MSRNHVLGLSGVAPKESLFNVKGISVIVMDLLRIKPHFSILRGDH